MTINIMIKSQQRLTLEQNKGGNGSSAHVFFPCYILSHEAEELVLRKICSVAIQQQNVPAFPERNSFFKGNKQIKANCSKEIISKLKHKDIKGFET